MGARVTAHVRSPGSMLCIPAAVIGLLLGSTAPASATTTYTYTGNNFTTFACEVQPPPPVPNPCPAFNRSNRVTASFTLQDPIPANENNLDLVPLMLPPFLTMSDGTGPITAMPPPDCAPFIGIALPCPTAVVSTDDMGRITKWRVSADSSGHLGSSFSISTSSDKGDSSSFEGGVPLCQSPGSICASGSVDLPGTWVPEPSTATLLTIGLAFLGCLGHRRKLQDPFDVTA
jgi:hypothetical protein